MSKRGVPIPAKDGRLVHEYSHDAAPLPEDAKVGEWSRHQLERMNDRFTTALQREIGKKDGQ